MEKEVICEGQEERWKNRNGWKKLKRKERKESYVNMFIILFFFKICELLALKYMYFDQFSEVQSFFSCDIRH